MHQNEIDSFLAVSHAHQLQFRIFVKNRKAICTFPNFNVMQYLIYSSRCRSHHIPKHIWIPILPECRRSPVAYLVFTNLKLNSASDVVRFCRCRRRHRLGKRHPHRHRSAIEMFFHGWNACRKYKKVNLFIYSVP